MIYVKIISQYTNVEINASATMPESGDTIFSRPINKLIWQVLDLDNDWVRKKKCFSDGNCFLMTWHFHDFKWYRLVIFFCALLLTICYYYTFCPTPCLYAENNAEIYAFMLKFDKVTHLHYFGQTTQCQRRIPAEARIDWWSKYWQKIC